MENGWERGRKVATVRKFRRWLKLILSGKKSVWSQQWGRRLKTPVLDYDHILNLEHKFKTWLIRSTRMKFNIWIKEILFITRFPYLCYYHESLQLLRSLCLWLCCYTESRARWQDIVRRALDAVINIRRTPSNWEKSARTLCRFASLPLIIDYTSYQRYSYAALFLDDDTMIFVFFLCIWN